MNNRTQLMIGVALFGIVAVLFVLSEFRAGKLEDQQAGKKSSEQAAAEPKKKTQVTLEPEVASEQAAAVGVRDKQSGLGTEPEPEPESSPDHDGSETFEGEETPEPEESEAPINPILTLVDKIDGAAGKVRVLSNLARSIASTGDAEQANAILAQAGEIMDTIEAVDELASTTGFFASAKLHMGETDAAMEMLERTLGLVKKIEGNEAKLAAVKQLIDVLGEFPDNERVQKFITSFKEHVQALTHPSNPILSLINNIEGSEGRMRVLCNLAGTLAQAGDIQQATSLLAEAQKIVDSIEDKSELSPSLSYLAVAQIKLGKPDEAKVTLATALSTVDKIEGIEAKVGSFGKLITALNELDDQEQIRTVIAQSLNLAGEIQQKAQVVLQQSLTLVSKMKDGEEKATALQQIASAMSQPGNPKRSEEIFVQALTIATQIADAEKKALVLEKIASTFSQTGSGGNFSQLQFSIGWMYFEGQNLPKDHARAVSWFRKAAELGHPQAQVNLAMMHMEGKGVPANNAEALKWFTQAAEQGDTEGQTALGMMYALGRGVETDLVQANKWIFIAAEQGDKEALSARTQLAEKLTPEQLAESIKLAKEWQVERGAKPSASAPVPEPKITAGK